ncbi:MAG TPA: BON domain-containing protein [Pyrinomonadaceae bacterium]|nr:BON domain-containing protein [Pyrinomonadaceae bacterium]
MALFTYICGCVLFLLAMTGCSTTAVNTNANTNISNDNSNTAILVNARPANTNSDRGNANISREDYDRNRAEYERDRGTSTIGQGVDDSWIWFKTRAALATANDLRESTINVDVENNVITLRGTVANDAQRKQAETIARSIEGQKNVRNQLTVRPGDSMTNQMVNGNTSNTNQR